jgi:hypothetical protein
MVKARTRNRVVMALASTALATASCCALGGACLVRAHSASVTIRNDTADALCEIDVAARQDTEHVGDLAPGEAATVHVYAEEESAITVDFGACGSRERERVEVVDYIVYHDAIDVRIGPDDGASASVNGRAVRTSRVDLNDPIPRAGRGR